MKPRQVVSMFLLACAGSLVCAQTVAPFYSTAYSVANLGSVTGVPTNYGGLTFKAGDPNTILLGGSANRRLRWVSGSTMTAALPTVPGVCCSIRSTPSTVLER